MLHHGMASPAQLKALKEALDEYCQVYGVKPGTPAHQDAAWQIMELFYAGVAERSELLAALQAPSKIKR